MSEKLTHITRPAEKKRWYRSPKVLRHGVMAFFFLFLLHVSYDHQVKGGGPRGTPSVEAYCPFGGLENLYQFMTTGGYVRHIEPSAMILMAALVLLTLIASRGFCGWICPFGSVQEWIGLLGKKLFRRKYNPTGAWDVRLRYLKYVVLVVIIGLTWYTGALVFRQYDPFLAFFHLGSSMSELMWGYAILVVVLGGSLFIERFFCKYACPLGAVLGILGKVGLTRIQRETDGCKTCNVCYQTCHAHIDFLSRTTIRDSECNHCMDCVVDCPKPNVLSMRGPKWRLSHAAYAFMLVGGLFLLIGSGKLTGAWQTKPQTVTFTDKSGRPVAGNIRGWMTLEEVSNGYGIPLDRLYQAAGLPKQVAASTRLNMIAKTYKLDFEPDKLREVVDGILSGVSHPAAQSSPISKSKAPRREPEAGHAADPEQEVKGFMTLNEIALKNRVPAEYILRTLALPPDIDRRLPVREWMHAHGKSIQDLRAAVAQYRAEKRQP